VQLTLEQGPGLQGAIAAGLADLRLTMSWAERLACVADQEPESEQKELLNLSGIHGHRTSKAPHPVRSAQLTEVPPS
jgi:hypothetical protein